MKREALLEGRPRVDMDDYFDRPSDGNCTVAAHGTGNLTVAGLAHHSESTAVDHLGSGG